MGGKGGRFQVGFEVGTGEPVDAAFHHLFVSGLTQQSGKTTALEAFMSRMRPSTALVFRTGRGEIGFEDAHPTPPFFRERTDWQFVEGLLSAHLREKTKFYRGDVMRACRGASTLSDVAANVAARLKKARDGSFVEKILTELDQYFREVVPALRSVKFAPTLRLRPGANVVDLEDVPTAVQQLVVSACAERIMESMRDTVLVVPEAWEMIPEGRGSPVKLSVEAMIRKGAKIGNYCWLDSQQITGVDLDILRNVGIWLFGRQTLDREKRRVADSIPGHVVKADDVQALEIGQFYIVQYKTRVQKVYVRPAWLSESQAHDVAVGALGHQEVERPPARMRKTKVIPEGTGFDEKGLKKVVERATRAAVHDMSREIEGGGGGQGPLPKPDTSKGQVEGLTSAPANPAHPSVPDEINQQVRMNWKGDSSASARVAPIVRVDRGLASIEATVRRPVIQTDETSRRGRIAWMIASGFFSAQRRVSEVGGELAARGWPNDHTAGGNSRKALVAILDEFCQWEILRYENGRYVLVPEARGRIAVREAP